VAGAGRAGVVAGVVLTLVPLGVLTGLTIWADWDGPVPVLDLVTGLLAWAASPLVLWRPVGGALVLSVLALVSPAATPAASFSALQVARERRFPVALAVGATGLAAHAIQGAWRFKGGISYGWWLVLVALGYGALLGWGAWARARQALIRSLRERADRAEAEQGRRVAEARMLERRRIAWEMHDVLAHRLSLLATFAGAMEYRPDSSPEQMARAAGVVRSGVHEALGELREVITLLRDDEPGYETKPQPVLADLPRLIEESTAAGAEVRLHDDVRDPAALPAAAARTAYRVVQEGLTNARKHATGRPVAVTMTGEPGAHLDIDIRNPLPPEGSGPTVPGTGTGLVGLTERVRLAGGELNHDRASGEFRLHASIPWPA
jgi:signal transduction histidine kinase